MGVSNRSVLRQSILPGRPAVGVYTSERAHGPQTCFPQDEISSPHMDLDTRRDFAWSPGLFDSPVMGVAT